MTIYLHFNSHLFYEDSLFTSANFAKCKVRPSGYKVMQVLGVCGDSYKQQYQFQSQKFLNALTCWQSSITYFMKISKVNLLKLFTEESKEHTSSQIKHKLE